MAHGSQFSKLAGSLGTPTTRRSGQIPAPARLRRSLDFYCGYIEKADFRQLNIRYTRARRLQAAAKLRPSKDA